MGENVTQPLMLNVKGKTMLYPKCNKSKSQQIMTDSHCIKRFRMAKGNSSNLL